MTRPQQLKVKEVSPHQEQPNTTVISTTSEHKTVKIVSPKGDRGQSNEKECKISDDPKGRGRSSSFGKASAKTSDVENAKRASSSTAKIAGKDDHSRKKSSSKPRSGSVAKSTPSAETKKEVDSVKKSSAKETDKKTTLSTKDTSDGQIIEKKAKKKKKSTAKKLKPIVDPVKEALKLTPRQRVIKEYKASRRPPKKKKYIPMSKRYIKPPAVPERWDHVESQVAEDFEENMSWKPAASRSSSRQPASRSQSRSVVEGRNSKATTHSEDESDGNFEGSTARISRKAKHLLRRANETDHAENGNVLESHNNTLNKHKVLPPILRNSHQNTGDFSHSSFNLAQNDSINFSTMSHDSGKQFQSIGLQAGINEIAINTDVEQRNVAVSTRDDVVYIYETIEVEKKKKKKKKKRKNEEKDERRKHRSSRKWSSASSSSSSDEKTKHHRRHRNGHRRHSYSDYSSTSSSSTESSEEASRRERRKSGKDGKHRHGKKKHKKRHGSNESREDHRRSSIASKSPRYSGEEIANSRREMLSRRASMAPRIQIRRPTLADAQLRGSTGEDENGDKMVAFTVRSWSGRVKRLNYNMNDFPNETVESLRNKVLSNVGIPKETIQMTVKDSKKMNLRRTSSLNPGFMFSPSSGESNLTTPPTSTRSRIPLGKTLSLPGGNRASSPKRMLPVKSHASIAEDEELDSKTGSNPPTTAAESDRLAHFEEESSSRSETEEEEDKKQDYLGDRTIELPPPQQDLVQCQFCSRNFARPRIEFHESTCRKITQATRPVFDSRRNRIEKLIAQANASDQTILRDSIEGQTNEQAKIKPSKWRERHKAFIEVC